VDFIGIKFDLKSNFHSLLSLKAFKQNCFHDLHRRVVIQPELVPDEILLRGLEVQCHGNRI
jgi:hypothetical protein